MPSMRLLLLVLGAVLCAVAAVHDHDATTPIVMLDENEGLSGMDENVDKDLWLARKAQESADAEDLEIARLLAMLESLDGEKDAAVKEAKQREIEAKEATSAKLKETAKHKYEVAKKAIDGKAKRIEQGALSAQTDAADAVEKTKKLQVESQALMSKAKVAAEEYQSAVTAGMSDRVQELQIAAKKAMEQAQEAARAAGKNSQNAKVALAEATRIKEKADKAMKLERESRADLIESGLTWVSGPIFDKMKMLCERDYPTFRLEYRKLKMSPTYKGFRWDIKQACAKARDDDLESDYSPPPEVQTDPHNPPLGPGPYPRSHTHFAVPKGGKVAKWCSTQYGAVPCSMLEKAKAAGLLGDIGPNKSKQLLLEIGEETFAIPSGAETTYAESDQHPTSAFPGPPHGLPGYKESHQWEKAYDVFSPIVFDTHYFQAAFGSPDDSEMETKKKWMAFLKDDDKKVPYCDQGSASFSLNTYYRANPGLSDRTNDGQCGKVLEQYLTSGLYDGVATYSAAAEASFKAKVSEEELSKLQGNQHAQKIKLESDALGAQPNCEMDQLDDSTDKYAWSFWYRPEPTGAKTANLMSFGDSPSSKHAPAVFESTGADGNLLHFKVSQTNDNTWGCSPSKPLSKPESESSWNLVAFNVNKEGVEVFYNGEMVANCKNEGGSPMVFKDARLYLATSHHGSWGSSRSFIKGLTFYPGSQLSQSLIQAEVQHQQLQATALELEAESRSAKSAVLGEQGDSVTDLADSIDARLHAKPLPEEEEDEKTASDIDAKLQPVALQDAGRNNRKRSNAGSSVQELANSVDQMLWSGHANRNARADAQGKLEALQQQSDNVDSLVKEQNSLAQELSALNSKVDQATEKAHEAKSKVGKEHQAPEKARESESKGGKKQH